MIDVAWRFSYIGLDLTWTIASGISARDAWTLLPATGALWIVLYKGEWDGFVLTPAVSEASGVQLRQFVMGTDWYGLTPDGGYVQGMGLLPDFDGRAALLESYPGCDPKQGSTASQEEWSRVTELLDANHDIPIETSAALTP